VDLYRLIEELKKERNYLESPLELYKKVKRFEEACERALEEKGELPPGLVFQEFVKAFELKPEETEGLQELVGVLADDPTVEEEVLLEVLGKDALLGDVQLQEVKRVLFLLRKPFLLARRKRQRQVKQLDPAKCPVCDQYISLTLIDLDNRRHMVCTLCGHREEVTRIGCSYCLHKNPEKIKILVDEDEIRVELCELCKTYIKSFKDEVYRKYKDPNLIDILSLPLDVVAQQRGFIRRSPNAIGVREIG